MELALRRGVMIQRAITEALWEKEGYEISQQALSKWITGRSQVDKGFPSAFARAMGLDEEERARLAEVFAYGQDEPITIKGLEH